MLGKISISEKVKLTLVHKIRNNRKTMHFFLKIPSQVAGQMSRVTIHQIRMEKYQLEAEIQSI